MTKENSLTCRRPTTMATFFGSFFLLQRYRNIEQSSFPDSADQFELNWCEYSCSVNCSVLFDNERIDYFVSEFRMFLHFLQLQFDVLLSDYSGAQFLFQFLRRSFHEFSAFKQQTNNQPYMNAGTAVWTHRSSCCQPFEKLFANAKLNKPSTV